MLKLNSGTHHVRRNPIQNNDILLREYVQTDRHEWLPVIRILGVSSSSLVLGSSCFSCLCFCTCLTPPVTPPVNPLYWNIPQPGVKADPRACVLATYDAICPVAFNVLATCTFFIFLSFPGSVLFYVECSKLSMKLFLPFSISRCSGN